MYSYGKLAILVAAGSLFIATAAEARQNRTRVSGNNGVAVKVAGEKGSAFRARGAVKNEDGSVTSGSSAGFKGANGSTGARASTTTLNPDGSATRKSQATATGTKGAVSTASHVSRTADGSYTGGRTSTATSSATDNTYHGSTQIDPATGKPVHTATCTDASGASIACPR